jgi:hypothetical protein
MKTIFSILLISTIFTLNAKEIELVIKRNSPYPMNIHYQVTSGTRIYAQGQLKQLKANTPYYIYINQLPDTKPITLKVTKMSFHNVTVFNDPCDITLNNGETFASITVGFHGDPDPTHHSGAFTCHVSKNLEN